MAVNAANVEGLAGSGRAADLVALATAAEPSGLTEWVVASSSLLVSGHDAVELVRPDAPGDSRRIVWTVGDWKIQVNATGVDSKTVRQFAQGFGWDEMGSSMFPPRGRRVGRPARGLYPGFRS